MKRILVVFLGLLLLTTFVFADRTNADNSTHSQNSVIEQCVDG